MGIPLEGRGGERGEEVREKTFDLGVTQKLKKIAASEFKGQHYRKGGESLGTRLHVQPILPLLMRDEKEERTKQARSNMYMYLYVDFPCRVSSLPLPRHDEGCPDCR